MSLNFSIGNVVYVKNLSTDVFEKHIKEKFESCDEIINITFKNFSGKKQKYCQIEFKSSEGITKASRLNGELLLNIPMVVTVIEPVSHTQSINDNPNSEFDKNSNNLDIKNVTNNNNSSIIKNQNIQNILLQKQLISEQKKGLVDFQNSLNAKNNKFDVFSKIIYMENIPENFNEEDINNFFKNVGKTTSYKIQYNEPKKMYIAFVEFKNEEHAKAALNLNGYKVDKHEICIRDAYSLINEKDFKNNFSFYSNNKDDNNPTNKQAINEKIERVLALKERLTLKLCAMYNPNLLLVNNLIKENNMLLNGIKGNNEIKANSEIENSEKNLNDNEKELLNNPNDAKLKNNQASPDKSCDERKKKNIKISKSLYSSSVSRTNSDSDHNSRSSSSYDNYRKNSKTSPKKKIIKRHKITKKRKKYKSRSKRSYNSNSSSRSSYESEKMRYRRRRRRKCRSSSSCSYSSYSSRRRYRDTDNYTPWWIKESEKMEMKQRMKERHMREISMREKYRRKR